MCKGLPSQAGNRVATCLLQVEAGGRQVRTESSGGCAAEPVRLGGVRRRRAAGPVCEGSFRYGEGVIMPLTRRQRVRVAKENLPLEPNVLAHVLSALSVHHKPSDMAAASAVCRGWYERVEAANSIEDEPDNVIGELRSGDKPFRFDRPHDAIFLPNGDICVADCDNFRLQIVSREGYFANESSSREVRLTGGTSCPTGVALAGESLFVVEHGSHQVSKLRRQSNSGHRHAIAGGWGGGDGQLRHPWSVAVASRRVYVTDTGNDRVSVFDTEKLQWLFSFGKRGSGSGEFREPRGIAAHDSELFVADYANHRIAVFSIADASDATCPPVRIIGGGDSSIAGRFSGPSGVCIANDKLHVAEIGGERLQLLSLDGLPLQCVLTCGPCSGVCADDEYVCVTCLEGDHALTLWRTQTPTGILTPRSISE